jgi:membrane protease YdiL (CAAX protease family)
VAGAARAARTRRGRPVAGLVGRIEDLYTRATAGPSYPPDVGDLADVRIFGLGFPLRASVAVLVTTAMLVIDQLRWLVPSGPIGVVEPVRIARFALFLLVPLAVIVLGFRDKPGRYALRLGDWRWGVGLLLAGLAVMTPIILGLAQLSEFRGYYGAAAESIGVRLLNGLIELIPAEFLLRGFLMFALWRRIGPLALVVSLVPFVFTHFGKPAIELWSTFIGGAIFAWLDWRTGSILWSALGHVYVLTLMLLAVGGATIH